MTTSTDTQIASRYSARAISGSVLGELRQADDSGRPLHPFVASGSGQPIACVGSPLRCCLRAIEPGERVALVSYAPLRRWAAARSADPGGYDEVGPVFIHADPCSGPSDRRGGHPHTRPGALRAVRCYDVRGHIVGGRLVELTEDPTASLDAAIDDAFADPTVQVVHVRAVEHGCFQFEVRRNDGAILGRPTR
ncbi:MAG: DUF1203 domain-containing protein [Propionibacteriaceae bacterium]